MDSSKTFDLRPLLQPKSIAMVGASEKNFFSMMIFENLRKQGFQGKVFPINPKYKELAGHPCYPSLKDLPEAPDTVIIMTRRDLVLGFVKDAIAMGARSATIVSAGFAETAEEEWVKAEQEIVRIAYENNFPVCGPNCLGIFSVREHVATMAAPIRGGAIPGNVGLVMQSGGMMLGLTYPFYQRRIGISYAISTGNSSTVDCSDYIDFLVEDEHTQVICAFIEGIRKPARFVEVAKKALKAGKPIIALKTGASERGTRSAMAHTGSVAGNDDVNDAIFRKYGVIRVNDFDELMESASVFSKTFASGKLPKAPNMCIISASGGSVGLLSDLSKKLDVPLPEFLPETQEALREMFPAGAFVCNPIDATGQVLNDLSTYRKALEIVRKDPQIGIVVSFETVGFPGDDTPTHHRRLLNTVEICDELDIPLVSGSLSTHALNAGQQDYLMGEGRVSLVQGAGKVLRAVSYLLQYTEFLRRYNEAPLPAAADEGRVKAAKALLEGVEGRLDDDMSKALLALYGIEIGEAACGAEMAVCGINDPQFGPAVTVGLGGIYKAALPDVVAGAGTVSVDEAKELIIRAKAGAVLAGRDVDSLAKLAAAVSALVNELSEKVSSVRLDPVAVLEENQGVRISKAAIDLK